MIPSRRSLGPFAVGAAWFFIVVSLLHVVWAAVVKLGDPGATFKTYHTVVGGVSYDAWGLTYSGIVGVLLVLLQLLVVSGATAASVLSRPGLVRWRRLGHVVLIGWAALWMLNLVRLAAIDGQLDSIAQATLLCVLFGCTAYRATRGWSSGRSRSTFGGPAGGVGDPAPGAVPVPPPPPVPPEDPEPDVGSARTIGRHLGSLIVVGAAGIRSVKPAAQGAATSARRKAAAGLHRVAEFTRRQADRVAPDTGE